MDKDNTSNKKKRTEKSYFNPIVNYLGWWVTNRIDHIPFSRIFGLIEAGKSKPGSYISLLPLPQRQNKMCTSASATRLVSTAWLLACEGPLADVTTLVFDGATFNCRRVSTVWLLACKGPLAGVAAHMNDEATIRCCLASTI